MRLGAAAILAASLGAAAPRPAAAESHKLMVLQSEGRVDGATRAKIDAAVLRLALVGEPQATPGDLNFTDAATAVGCKPEAPTCKDEVLGMLGVDEIVITTVAPRPGGVEVSVRRVAKGGATREATAVLATGAPPDKLDALAPVFSDAAAPSPAAPSSGAPARVAPATPSPATPSPSAPVPTPEITAERPAEHSSDAPLIPAPTDVKPAAPSPVVTPAADRGTQTTDTDPGRRRLELIGMAGGGGMLVLSFVLWGAASGVQSDIDKAPATTSEDIQHLRDLESKGDTYATLGNVFAVTGVIVGGVSTYLFIRDRRAASSATARLSPTLLDHGAGVVLTIGGTP
ncbi:MAG TPA: hypothetical protein VLM79_02585 [Kofleriaceae bacterium]|nr:hypothetical protein [Kofleriaceae bacterium]